MLRYLALQRVSLHPSAYVSIRQLHTSAYDSVCSAILRSSASACLNHTLGRLTPGVIAGGSCGAHTSAYVSICQHMSAYAPGVWRHRWQQLRRAYVSIRQHTNLASGVIGGGSCGAHASQLRLHPRNILMVLRLLRVLSCPPHMSAYVRIRPHTSAYVSIRPHTSSQYLDSAATAARPQLPAALLRQSICAFVLGNTSKASKLSTCPPLLQPL
jgi:hypothetical protein